MRKRRRGRRRGRRVRCTEAGKGIVAAAATTGGGRAAGPAEAQHERSISAAPAKKALPQRRRAGASTRRKHLDLPFPRQTLSVTEQQPALKIRRRDHPRPREKGGPRPPCFFLQGELYIFHPRTQTQIITTEIAVELAHFASKSIQIFAASTLRRLMAGTHHRRTPIF